MTLRWFEMTDAELKNIIQELVDIRNKINSRKEYLRK